jgi:hypothetical protein
MYAFWQGAERVRLSKHFILIRKEKYIPVYKKVEAIVAPMYGRKRKNTEERDENYPFKNF